MLIDIISLFPEYFEGPFDVSIIGQAQKKGILNIKQTNLRDFANNKHNRVDDRPFGGGPGMVLMPGPVVDAIRSVKSKEFPSRVVFLSPQGQKLSPSVGRRLAAYPHLVFLCGHYEGIDQRAIDSEVDEEISIGDYVLTNGCLAAMVVIDVLVRFIPGVLGHNDAAELDSFENGLLEHPQYTQPRIFEGVDVPEVLLNGDHKKISRWRHEAAKERTKLKRPDLIND